MTIDSIYDICSFEFIMLFAIDITVIFRFFLFISTDLGEYAVDYVFIG